ncbi:MAG: hypothetical protein ACR9NN_18070 [Nostochopsis sp.]
MLCSEIFTNAQLMGIFMHFQPVIATLIPMMKLQLQIIGDRLKLRIFCQCLQRMKKGFMVMKMEKLQ